MSGKPSKKRKRQDPRHEQGIAFVKEGKYAEAVPLFKSLLKEHPTLRDAWYGLGYCYYKNGDLEQSRLLMERAKGLGHPAADKMLRRIAERFEETSYSQDVWGQPASPAQEEAEDLPGVSEDAETQEAAPASREEPDIPALPEDAVSEEMPPPPSPPPVESESEGPSPLPPLPPASDGFNNDVPLPPPFPDR